MESPSQHTAADTLLEASDVPIAEFEAQPMPAEPTAEEPTPSTTAPTPSPTEPFLEAVQRVRQEFDEAREQLRADLAEAMSYLSQQQVETESRLQQAADSAIRSLTSEQEQLFDTMLQRFSTTLAERLNDTETLLEEIRTERAETVAARTANSQEGRQLLQKIHEAARSASEEMDQQLQQFETHTADLASRIAAMRNDLRTSTNSFTRRNHLISAVTGLVVALTLLGAVYFGAPFWTLSEEQVTQMHVGSEVLHTYRNATDQERIEMRRIMKWKEPR
jgi:hypothetical protein